MSRDAPHTGLARIDSHFPALVEVNPTTSVDVYGDLGTLSQNVWLTDLFLQLQQTAYVLDGTPRRPVHP